MHLSSLKNMFKFREKYLKGRENEPLFIVDLGSLDINGSYRNFFDLSCWTYLGTDMIPGKNVDIVLRNPYKWKEIKSDSVDVLISGQAFEHMEFIWVVMLEIERVLRPGGLCCILAPSGGPEHRYPVDCWRFHPDGFKALARFAHLETMEAVTDHGAGYTDSSNLWRDTILVCRKVKLSCFYSLRRRIWRSLLHKMLTWRLSY